jgi:predicted HTH transcriptional regulator
MQQLVRNALMHRTYENTNAPVQVHWFDNRIEIRNPGGPFGAVNETNFGQPGIVDYRNPRIADAMKVLGLVQRFGIGIQTAQLEMTRNGNPPITFKVDSSTVTCVLYAAPVNAPVNAPDQSVLSKVQQEILMEVRRNPKLSYDELTTRLKRDRSTIMRNMRKLKETGLIRREGSDKTGKWLVR